MSHQYALCCNDFYYQRKEGTIWKLSRKKNRWEKIQISVSEGMLYAFSNGKKKKYPLYRSHWELFHGYDTAWIIETITNQSIVLGTTDEIEMHKWLNYLKRQVLMVEETIENIVF